MKVKITSGDIIQHIFYKTSEDNLDSAVSKLSTVHDLFFKFQR